MKAPFLATRRGIEVALSPDEVELLGALPRLLGSVGEQEGDPAAARLSPRVHADDAAERDYRELVGGELARERVDDREVFTGTLRRGAVLDGEEAEAWLRVIGETRLVLAARIGITQDGWSPEDFPEHGDAFLVHYLGWLQESLVMALMPSLPTVE